jgi:hypothetical protein
MLLRAGWHPLGRLWPPVSDQAKERGPGLRIPNPRQAGLSHQERQLDCAVSRSFPTGAPRSDPARYQAPCSKHLGQCRRASSCRWRLSRSGPTTSLLLRGDEIRDENRRRDRRRPCELPSCGSNDPLSIASRRSTAPCLRCCRPSRFRTGRFVRKIRELLIYFQQISLRFGLTRNWPTIRAAFESLRPDCRAWAGSVRLAASRLR